MTASRVFDLVHWISEREAIRVRREMGIDPPWTGDPVMASVRFTNVRREDDTTTRWIAANWRDEFVLHPNYLKALVLARLVNHIPTLEEIGYPHDWDLYAYASKLHARAKRGAKVWTSAYTISTCGQRIPKEVYVCGVVDHVSVAVNHGTRIAHTLAKAHEVLLTVMGLGSFLAAQVVADIKNTPGHTLQNAVDWWGWCAPGPGSIKGLNSFFNRPQDTPVSPVRFREEIDECWFQVRDLLPDDVPHLHMQDFQNCLCEFSKYIRVKYEGGRARNKYVASRQAARPA